MAKIALLKVTAKCSDLCNIKAVDASGNEVATHDGYVPDFFPGQHFGDYVEIHIDPATGQITNWKPPTQTIMKQQLNGD